MSVIYTWYRELSVLQEIFPGDASRLMALRVPGPDRALE
jgi:hypothetical protein